MLVTGSPTISYARAIFRPQNPTSTAISYQYRYNILDERTFDKSFSILNLIIWKHTLKLKFIIFDESWLANTLTFFSEVLRFSLLSNIDYQYQTHAADYENDVTPTLP